MHYARAALLIQDGTHTIRMPGAFWSVDLDYIYIYIYLFFFFFFFFYNFNESSQVRPESQLQ